jgi:hypothetical protein
VIGPPLRIYLLGNFRSQKFRATCSGPCERRRLAGAHETLKLGLCHILPVILCELLQPKTDVVLVDILPTDGQWFRHETQHRL